MTTTTSTRQPSRRASRSTTSWVLRCWLGTAEFLFTKNVKEIVYQNLNYIPARTTLRRPLFDKRYDNKPQRRHVAHQLGKGKSWQTTFNVERPFRNGFYVRRFVPASGPVDHGERRHVRAWRAALGRVHDYPCRALT